MAGENATNSPIQAFSLVSGIDPTNLRLILSAFLIAGLLLAYAWAINSGFKGFALGNKTPLEFLFFILKGAAVVLCVLIFFIY
ncbi:integrating conjugative element protein, PFL_4701 family [Pasteurella testudinis DSM 23072]|uniref:Integrating conjugative element protein, PFL_4701 family n=1 Tax=Pasteurella testudinis DSM 23072 TaxID=1122938 RepID=A0A1W1UVZ1_9PAST|nr:DUF3262 family protein [Pasteurella testudinis]SMB85159.1 integrating conjugative element protein, PFL_4701 family [Pasteurella testudinis DSM 23072]SUB52126.1 integrating conjugative element protein, PFL_4701 family [Pasteurella testudinis]